METNLGALLASSKHAADYRCSSTPLEEWEKATLYLDGSLFMDTGVSVHTDAGVVACRLEGEVCALSIYSSPTCQALVRTGGGVPGDPVTTVAVVAWP